MQTFDFGTNWRDFSAERGEIGRLLIAPRSLQGLLQHETLRGLSVLDVGCGAAS